MQEFKSCHPTDHQTLMLCLLNIQFQWGTKHKKKRWKEDKRNVLAFSSCEFFFHSDIPIKQQRMFKQRFQSQTLLACLFNYISGRLQLSSNSGLCFHRLLKFSASFDPAASIQFNNSIQNKPSQPCSSIHQGHSATTRFFPLYFHFLGFVSQLPAVLTHMPWCLEGATRHSKCNTEQEHPFVPFPALMQSVAGHGKNPHQHLGSSLAGNNSEG